MVMGSMRRSYCCEVAYSVMITGMFAIAIMFTVISYYQDLDQSIFGLGKR